MKRSMLAAMFFVGLVLLGCDGAVSVGSPELTAVVMDVSTVTVYWEQNADIEQSGDFAGYNVYVYTDSAALLADDGEDLNKFNSQVITDTAYQAAGLSQDSVYYVQVRTVNLEDKVGGYNTATPFLKASPRPEFTVLMRLALGGPAATDSCAVRYADGMIMADSLMADSSADMWVKVLADTVWLVSPDSHPLYGAAARQTLFTNIGPAEFDGVSVVLAEPDAGDSRVSLGDMAIAKTEDGNYVKLRVEALDATNGTITVLYAYQNITGFPYF